MRTIRIIAENTYREIIRDRILYILLVFALLFLGVSMALGSLSVQEQVRISINFGFTAIHFSSIVLSIFVGGALVSKEIDKKTILTLLVRPITRNQFIIGKALGLAAVILTIILGFGLVMIPVLWFFEMSISWLFVIGLFGVFLESVVILGFSIFFSSFTRPAMIASFTFGIFLIGHFLDSLDFFASRSQSDSFKAFSKVVNFVMPHLEKFNWRSLYVYGQEADMAGVGIAVVYCFFWFALLISATGLVLRRKDFV